MRYFPPIHPGEVLQEEFLIPLKISQNQLSRVMRVPPNRINNSPIICIEYTKLLGEFQEIRDFLISVELF
jgi:hypothetical protein